MHTGNLSASSQAILPANEKKICLRDNDVMSLQLFLPDTAFQNMKIFTLLLNLLPVHCLSTFAYVDDVCIFNSYTF